MTGTGMHPVIVAAITAAVAYEAIRSGAWPTQALGVLIVIVGLGTIYSDLQLRFNPPTALDHTSMPQTIRVSFGERILPWVFGASTAIIILVAAVYTAHELGWW